LRVKGFIVLDDGTLAVLQVVGRRAEVTPAARGALPSDRTEVVAVALAGTPQPTPPTSFVSRFS
jgi:hypothetical protein